MSKPVLGVCVTGSFCTFEKVFAQLEGLTRHFSLLPIFSFNAAGLDTRFGKAADHLARLKQLSSRDPILTIPQAEPIGPKGMTDILAVVPCTGNTLAKLAHSIVDTPVTMAVKSHLRNGRPVVVGVSTNDALAGAAQNLAALQNRKHYYFVPYRQDNSAKKPTSLVADFSRLEETLWGALEGKQVQPMVLGET